MNQIAELYRDLGPTIYRQCVSILRDREEAADATHEVFTKLLTERRLSDRSHAAAWVYRVAVHHCLNLVRNRQKRGARLHEEGLHIAPRIASDLHVERDLILRVLRHVDQETSAIAVGVLVHEIDQTELAQILGLSRRTVARKLQNFIHRSRQLIGEAVG